MKHLANSLIQNAIETLALQGEIEGDCALASNDPHATYSSQLSSLSSPSFVVVSRETVASHIVTDDEQWRKFQASLREKNARTGMRLLHKIDFALKERMDDMELVGKQKAKMATMPSAPTSPTSKPATKKTTKPKKRFSWSARGLSSSTRSLGSTATSGGGGGGNSSLSPPFLMMRSSFGSGVVEGVSQPPSSSSPSFRKSSNNNNMSSTSSMNHSIYPKHIYTRGDGDDYDLDCSTSTLATATTSSSFGQEQSPRQRSTIWDNTMADLFS